MTKQQFLSELKKALNTVSEEVCEEILSDISEHFSAAINNYAESVKLSTTAGNAKLTTNETGELRISSAAGNVKAEVTKINGETKLTSSAGNIDLTAQEVAANIRISTAAGSTTVRLPRDANCKIKAKKPVGGSLKNEITDNPQSPHVLKISSAVGSIKIKAI
ncbi:MAG: DUF4097 family beta strand repeat-containing protein [Defluviitaleaceae bacterium]|nr:DUF4097 family beta strand repeat-containing protein [Defluviitaleaceae bacterium]